MFVPKLKKNIFLETLLIIHSTELLVSKIYHFYSKIRQSHLVFTCVIEHATIISPTDVEIYYFFT